MRFATLFQLLCDITSKLQTNSSYAVANIDIGEMSKSTEIALWGFAYLPYTVQTEAQPNAKAWATGWMWMPFICYYHLALAWCLFMLGLHD
jgi:hypothetical protein